MKTSNKIANFIWHKIFRNGGVIFTLSYLTFALAANNNNDTVSFNGGVALMLFSFAFAGCSAVMLLPTEKLAIKKILHWLLTSTCVAALVIYMGSVTTHGDISEAQVMILVLLWSLFYGVSESYAVLRRRQAKAKQQDKSEYEKKFSK